MMMSGLTMRSSEAAGGLPLLTLVGDVDYETAPALERRLDDMIDAGATRIALDLSSVGFIDSTGLAVLVNAFHRLKMIGGRLAVICPQRGLRRVLEHTGLDKMLGVNASTDEAVESLAR